MQRLLEVISICALIGLVSGSRFSLGASKSGDYSLSVGQKQWLISNNTWVVYKDRLYQTSDNSLQLIDHLTKLGEDEFGSFTSFIYVFKPKGHDVIYINIINSYEGERPFVLFGQYFEDEFLGTDLNGKDGIASGFPSFNVRKSANLGFLAMGGIMFGDTKKKMGTWGTPDTKDISSGLDSGPLVLFREDSDDAMIITRFNGFMDTSTHYNLDNTGQGSVSWGVMGGVKKIPRDFTCWFIAYHSEHGIKEAIEGWGDIMRVKYKKTPEYRESDLTNNYIGYWTDNGAYYYYNTEEGKNYQQTVIDVKKYSDDMKIPYKYIQYDSWFYKKEPNRGGVIEWYSTPDIYPNGMQYIFNQTTWAVSAHNRWWSSKTVYAIENGGKYNFHLEHYHDLAIPLDQKFWTDLFAFSKTWGLIVYEQDWLNKEFDTLNITTENVNVGATWLKQMGKGAREAGVNIQYCMSPSRVALQGVEIPAVTQARASNDYLSSVDQWRIGISSHIADAVGIAPFKDNFWTTTVQPGNPYDKTEPHPALQSVVATLSTGPVGPSDKIGLSNVSLIMRTCNADGLILKPSFPAKAIDMQIKKAAFKGWGKEEIWTTQSIVSGQRFGIILAAGLQHTYTINSKSAKLEKLPLSVLYKYNNNRIEKFGSAESLTLDSNCTLENFCLYYTSPIIKDGSNTLAILGELNKWVPISPKRLREVVFVGKIPYLIIEGAVGEKVTYSFLINNEVISLNCIIPPSGVARMDLRKQRFLRGWTIECTNIY